MAMLAERRRKTKYVINPTRKPLWTTDAGDVKFGKDLMEKMGWEPGKGLGLKEQGMQEPLKVSYKNNTKGFGFKGNDDDWIEHQDEFNSLLNQLTSGNDSSFLKPAETEKNEVRSLEEKSKLSRARVHYQKFTRGKDLSRYSENDLACILGTNKIKKDKEKNREPEKTGKKETPDGYETSFGVTTINSGSIQDYFKKKFTLNNNTNKKLSNEQTQSEFSEQAHFKLGENVEVDSEELYRKLVDKEIDGLDENHLSLLGEAEAKKCKKRNKDLEDLETDVVHKKKKMKKEKRTANCHDVKSAKEEPERLINDKTESDSENQKRRKKKNKISKTDLDVEIEKVEEPVGHSERKKKKRKPAVTDPEEVPPNCDINTTEVTMKNYNEEDNHQEEELLDADSKKHQKRKKEKGEKLKAQEEESSNAKLQCTNLNSHETVKEPNEEHLDVELGKVKKRKKEKRRRLHSGEAIHNFEANQGAGDMEVGINTCVITENYKKGKEPMPQKKKSKEKRKQKSGDNEMDNKDESSPGISSDNIEMNSSSPVCIEDDLSQEQPVKHKKKKKEKERLEVDNEEELNCDEIRVQIEISNCSLSDRGTGQGDLCSESAKHKKKKKEKTRKLKGKDEEESNRGNNSNSERVALEDHKRKDDLEVEKKEEKGKKEKREKLGTEKKQANNEGEAVSDGVTVQIRINSCNLQELPPENEGEGQLDAENVRHKKKKKEKREKSEIQRMDSDSQERQTDENTSRKKSKKREQENETAHEDTRGNVRESGDVPKVPTITGDDDPKPKKEEKVAGEVAEKPVGVVHSHKPELFKKKVKDVSKNYTNDRVLKLICGAEIERFKGSNLKNLRGYGAKVETGG